MKSNTKDIIHAVFTDREIIKKFIKLSLMLVLLATLFSEYGNYTLPLIIGWLLYDTIKYIRNEIKKFKATSGAKQQ